MTESRAYRWIVGVGLALFAVLYVYKTTQEGLWFPSKVSKSGYNSSGNDFTAFYSAGEQARLGNNIYEWKTTSTPRRPYGYPPLFAVLPMMPLSLFSHNVALAIFHVLDALMLLAVFWMLKRLLWANPPPANAAEHWALQSLRLPLSGMLIVLALSWRFIHSNTNVGNANLYLLLLMTLALYVNARPDARGDESPRGGLLCGLAIAAATAIKVTPGLFGMYFFWSLRRWSMLGGALGLILFLFLVPAAWLGWSNNAKYLRTYVEFAAGKTAGVDVNDPDDPDRIIIGRPRPLDPNDSEYAHGVGVSFRGALTNLLTPSPALSVKAARGGPRTVNIMSVEPQTLSRVANACSLLLLLATIALTLGAGARRDVETSALSWSLVTVAMTLISPLTRIAHLVVLVIPIAALVALLQQRKISGAAQALALIALALLALVGAAPDGIKAMGAMTVALLVFYAALAVALRQIMAGEKLK